MTRPAVIESTRREITTDRRLLGVRRSTGKHAQTREILNARTEETARHSGGTSILNK